MSKKVLIVEPSLAVRGIAESLLRQNGYEVIAADTVSAARDILRSSKIDLILVASDINDDNGMPFFESLGADSSTAILPLLVLHDSVAGGEIAYPPEAVINKPFTPRDFLEAVAAFGGSQGATEEPSPFTGADLEDAIIDSALGLDKIEVDDAEIMDDDTGVYRKQNKKSKTESMIGYDFKINGDDSTKISKKNIDAIILPAEPDSEQATPEAPVQKAEEKKPEAETEKKEKEEFLGKSESTPVKPAPGLTESSKIEIITDQYGIAAPDLPAESSGDSVDSGETHDYDWFMNELQKEGSEDSAPKPAPSQQPPSSPKQKAEPVQPAPPPQKPTPEPKPQATHTEAVDQFINEFKKEMEKITGDAAGNIEVTNIAPSDSTPTPAIPETPGPKPDGLNWEEGVDKVSSADIKGMSEQLIDALGDKIARRIVDQLDKDIVYHLIKDSIDNILQRKSAEKSRQP